MHALQTKGKKNKNKSERFIQQRDAAAIIPNGKHAIQPDNQGATRRFPRRGGVTKSERHCESSLSVSDPLQRDANQVHLPAAQRILAAHHASEQRGRSLQFPRYRHGASNHHARRWYTKAPATYGSLPLKWWGGGGLQPLFFLFFPTVFPFNNKLANNLALGCSS